MPPNNNDVSTIDIPFEYRHHCWFCGEPSQTKFCFPPSFSEHSYRVSTSVIDCPHPKILVPCCIECYRLANQAEADSIWSVNEKVKRRLLTIYSKDLAIGINWTQEELANSGFEGGCFSGFQKSAWFMYEVAKARVSYEGWPISYHGVDVDITLEDEVFQFDGVTYPNINDAVSHYCQVFFMSPSFFQAVLTKVGVERFADAVRFCRLLVGATSSEQQQRLKDLC